jgi:peptidoglycan/LPS O-acetylase OafA/YrhL
MLHHHTLLGGGWIGVELFFVLSGFLITGILRRDRDSELYWKRFYTRRATRILPPVLLMIFVVERIFHPPVSSVLMYTFFLSNFVSSSSHGIFELGMLWSLAVEEHFYLLFPIAVRFLPRDPLMKLLAAVIVVEPLLRFAATEYVKNYIPIYFWTCFHLDGLAMGAMLALLLEDVKAETWLRKWSGIFMIGIGSAFVAISLLFPNHFERTANGHLFNLFGYSLISATSLFIVAFVLLHPKALMSRILETGPFVFIGTISYGLYLYHFESCSC